MHNIWYQNVKYNCTYSENVERKKTKSNRYKNASVWNLKIYISLKERREVHIRKLIKA